ncbi:MAG TPA: M1 family aminopeptidase [Burkholderiales bacterium]|nr:M1 family aminopeptidase [Burkholderiales bacterium]
MKRWLASTLAAASLACAAAEPDLSLDVRLDPATRELAATAELAAPRGFRFTPHPSLSVRRTTRLASGKLRIEYGGVLPALDRRIDFRGVLRALPPMAAPEGSFLPAGSGWYPQPSQRFTYRVRLRVDGSQKALVEGRLLEESSAKDWYEALFEQLVPAEGIDLMAGPYETSERMLELRGGKRISIRTYFTAELASLADAYLDDSARYLERYSAEIGAYPFSQFSIVASPLPSGFGMPTLTYIGAQVLRLPFIRATSLGHEVLHNWWGNGALVDYSRGNWSEGLTTFMADYAFKEDESPQAARDMRLGWLRDLAATPPGTQRALAGFHSREHGADAVTGYGKSAMLFFMLRDAIGEAAFSRGIRGFWREQRFKIASWDDLRAAFEQASGRDLRGFFSQWVERPGAPAISIASARQQGKLELQIAQSEPAYALRIPVEIRFADRAETRWVEIDDKNQVVSIELAQRAVGVRLDPDVRVYRRLTPEELPPILRQWILARSPHVLFATRGMESGKTLAEHFFEAPFRVTDKASDEPLLIIGLHADVDAALARLGLPAPPSEVTGKGTAQVWTVRAAATPVAAPVAVVSAKDAASLAALARPLPHYGAQSWLVFEGARAIARGSWPPSPRAVPVEK